MDCYTENFADFGAREISILKDILEAWLTHGLPDDFYNDDIRPAMNLYSGEVFLVNADYQNVMLNNENKLEVLHYLPYSGREGFLSDLIEDRSEQDFHPDDWEYLSPYL